MLEQELVKEPCEEPKCGPSPLPSLLAPPPPTSFLPSRLDTDDTPPSSLSDLSLAVFLESLYTLEIASADGFSSSMLKTNDSPGSQEASGTYSSMHTPSLGADSPMSGSSTSELAGGMPPFASDSSYAESAFLRTDLVYSVPSDMRWWNVAWSLPDAGVTTEDFASRAAHIPDPVSPRTMLHDAPSDGETDVAPAKRCCSSHGKPSPVPAPSVGHDTVHCVPNPNAPGCSCLCGSELALLSLQRSLQASPLAQDALGEDVEAASSLVFTLKMSQSITKQCTCSVDCPTCRTNPAHGVHAELLISTALQIYARALKVFQEVLISDRNDRCGCANGAPCAACPCTATARPPKREGYGSGVDVRIGDFWPTPKNARKIALYAMRLELYDLERALAHVQDRAQQSLTPRTVPGERGTKAPTPLLLNPIDQLVIRKLHTQLHEVLRTVETMEGAESDV